LTKAWKGKECVEKEKGRGQERRATSKFTETRTIIFAAAGGGQAKTGGRGENEGWDQRGSIRKGGEEGMTKHRINVLDGIS